MTINSKDYLLFQPTRNYRCIGNVKPKPKRKSRKRRKSKKHIDIMSKKIEKCSRVFKNIKLIKKISAGGYGSIYLSDVKKDDKKEKVLVKIEIVGKNLKKVNKRLDDLTKEVEFSYYMSENLLSPKIYDSFFYFDRNTRKILQISIMEKYNMDCYDAIKKLLKVNKYDEIIFIIREMIKLLHKQIFEYNLFCTDIKPSNFVINLEKMDVRIIDFGIDFCSFSQHFSMREKNLFYSSILLFYYLFLQDYILYGYGKLLDELFINEKRFSWIFKRNNINILVKYILGNNNLCIVFDHYLNIKGKTKIIREINKLKSNIKKNN